MKEFNKLTMAYGAFVVQQNLTFTVNRGDIFIIMGGSGCGKSTLMRHMIGLKKPAKGTVNYDYVSFWDAEPAQRERLMRKFGIFRLQIGRGKAQWAQRKARRINTFQVSPLSSR